jgi:hypothetical protein
MAVEAHLTELAVKHRKLDDALSQEMKRPSSDWQKVAELKKQKLRIKEEIERLSNGAH